ASAPQLTTIRQNGLATDVVAMAGKTGFLYVFNRVTGAPIWPIEERPVPTKTEVAGEAVWPTQPFPTKPPPVARQTFTADDINPYLLTPAQQKRFQQHCSTCHGPDRAGTPNGPSLVGVGSRLSSEEMRSAVYDGMGRMPPLSHLNMTDVDAVVAYLAVVDAGPGGRGSRGAAALGVFPPGPVVESGPALA